MNLKRPKSGTYTIQPSPKGWEMVLGRPHNALEKHAISSAIVMDDGKITGAIWLVPKNPKKSLVSCPINQAGLNSLSGSITAAIQALHLDGQFLSSLEFKIDPNGHLLIMMTSSDMDGVEKSIESSE